MFYFNILNIIFIIYTNRVIPYKTHLREVKGTISSFFCEKYTDLFSTDVNIITIHLSKHYSNVISIPSIFQIHNGFLEVDLRENILYKHNRMTQ